MHAVTRRTARRTFFLTPTEAVNQVMGYLLGLCLARRSSLLLFAFFAHVNHVHGLLGDRGDLEGPTAPDELEHPSELPAFMAHFNGLTARSLNTHFGRGENFWRTGGYDNVEILDQTSLERQLLYVWTQAVRDGLVEHPDQYPGLKFGPDDFGKTFVFRKPDAAFFGGLRPRLLAPTDPVAFEDWRKKLEREERQWLAAAYERRRQTGRKRGRLTKRQRKLEEQRERRRLRQLQGEDETPRRDRSNMPEQVTITISVPPGYEGWPIEEVRAHFRELLDEEVARIHAERAEAGEPDYLGVERVLSQDPRESAGDTWPTFALNPRIACSDPAARDAAIKALKAWRAEMREKRRAWTQGKRDVVFPRGCYGMWRLHGALVAGGHVPRPPAADAPVRDAPT